MRPQFRNRIMCTIGRHRYRLLGNLDHHAGGCVSENARESNLGERLRHLFIKLMPDKIRVESAGKSGLVVLQARY
jgi:hypothetical protein